jgi:hypothetical protein
MTNKAVVRVSKTDISDSVPKNSERCMIASALHRSIPNARYVSVDVASVRYSDVQTGRRHIFLTPPNAQRALLQFDKGEKVEPFQFTLANGFDVSMRTRRHDTRKEERTSEWAERKKANPAAYAVKRYMPSRERQHGIRGLKA